MVTLAIWSVFANAAKLFNGIDYITSRRYSLFSFDFGLVRDCIFGKSTINFDFTSAAFARHAFTLRVVYSAVVLR